MKALFQTLYTILYIFLADDQWCTNLPQSDWPSNLMPTPRTLPPRPTTPPNVDHVSHGNNMVAKAVLVSIIVFIASFISIQ